MSTNYYDFADPISSIRQEFKGIHSHLTIFCNGQNCGSLVMSNEQAEGFLYLVRGDKIAHVYWEGGKDKGKCCKFYKAIDSKHPVISSYGKVTTLEKEL